MAGHNRIKFSPPFIASLCLFIPIRGHCAMSPENRELAKCAVMENSVQRLECFDSAANKLGVVKPARKSTKSGRWKVETAVSKIDDSKTVTLSLSAESEIHGWPGKIVRPELVVRCQEKRVEAYIITGMAPSVEYGRTDSATVTLRFDKEKAFDEVLNESTDQAALFFPSSKRIIGDMLKHDELLFRFTPFNSSLDSASFSLKGLPRAIEPLTDACNWDLKVPVNFETLAIHTPIQLNFRDGRVLKGEFASYSDSLGKYYVWTKEPDGTDKMQSYSRDELNAIVVNDSVLTP